MNILYLSNSSKPGGMEKHIADLVTCMKENGNVVYVWCPSGEYADVYKQSGAIHFNKKAEFECDIPYILSLIKFIKKEKIDVLHTHELKVGVNGLFAGFLAGCPVRTGHVHTPVSEWTLTGLKKFMKPVNIFIYSLAVDLFANIEISLTESRKKRKQKEGIFGNKLKVIPNGVVFSSLNVPVLQATEYKNEIRNRYSIPQNSFVFGNLGRITEEKGIDVLLSAFAKFLNIAQPGSTNYHLLIAGGGLLEEKMKTFAKDLGISKQITFTGVFPEEDKIKFFSSFDCFVFPTLAEGFGYVLVEAMYMGLPVVSSDLEVLLEVAGNNVVFFKTKNPDDLAEKMAQTNKDIVLGEYKLLQSAKDRVEKLYSMEAFKNNYAKLYLDLLEKSRKGNK